MVKHGKSIFVKITKTVSKSDSQNGPFQIFVIFDQQEQLEILTYDVYVGYMQLERAVGKYEKMENLKLESLKLKSFLFKLVTAMRNWKELSKVEKFLLKLESFAEIGKISCSWKVSSILIENFPTYKVTFKLQLELFNSSRNFPTSAQTFQLHSLQFHPNFSFFQLPF